MNFLLNSTEDAVLLIVLAVFAVIAIIYYICKSKFAKNESAESTDNALEGEQETTAYTPSDNNEEIIAVIAAAIAMAESESNGLKFKVVSFRRV